MIAKVLRALGAKWDSAQQSWYEKARADLQEKMKHQPRRARQ